MSLLAGCVLAFAPLSGHAQNAQRITTCGTAAPPAGTSQPYMDANGNLCTNPSGGGSIPAGSAIIGKVGIDQTTPGTTNAVATSPGARTLVTLAIKTVTTGGVAVNAMAAGARTAGGWLQNPPSATINLCINEIGTAVGTTSSGDTTCIVPGQSYSVMPAAGAVSVISSDSSHPFSGMGFQ